MKVKVTFEFNSEAEAIVFLDRSSNPVAPVKSAAVEPSQAAKAPDAAGSDKRGRGRPKKVNGPASVPAVGATRPAPQTPAAPTTKTVAPEKAPDEAHKADPAGVVPAPVAAVPTPEQVVAALQKVLKAKGMPVTQQVFQRWGVTRGAEVKDAARAEFIAYCEKVATGEVDPAKAAA